MRRDRRGRSDDQGLGLADRRGRPLADDRGVPARPRRQPAEAAPLEVLSWRGRPGEPGAAFAFVTYAPYRLGTSGVGRGGRAIAWQAGERDGEGPGGGSA